KRLSSQVVPKAAAETSRHNHLRDATSPRPEPTLFGEPKTSRGVNQNPIGRNDRSPNPTVHHSPSTIQHPCAPNAHWNRDANWTRRERGPSSDHGCRCIPNGHTD